MRPSKSAVPGACLVGMGEEWRALEPQPQRLPVDCAGDLCRHEGVAGECAGKRARPEGLPFEGQGRVEDRSVLAPVLHVHEQPLAGCDEAPVVVHVHRQEWRDVEVLAEVEAQLFRRSAARARRQHVAVLLAPRRVVDLGDDGVDASVLRIEAVIEADRVESVPEVAWMREEADRALGTDRAAARHQRPYALVERLGRGAVMVLAVPAGEGSAAGRPEPIAFEGLRQLCQVEVQHADLVPERVRSRRVPPVPNPPFVEATVHGGGPR